MNKVVEVEARPRPLSAGLWTLFSWLRRDDRSSSSDSISSAGSDRSVASFAFLAPGHYRTAPDPVILPPPGPPTDSYKKRVHERNVRRQYDRDLTLHRKYGLFKSEAGCSYDAFSLPPVRRVNVDCSNQWDRERRAASECLQRRSVHVPGKRRAPAPPVIGSSASVPRRHTRKRPAPQPPRKLLGINKENLETINTILTQMNVDSDSDKQKLGHNDVMMGCKSEKYCKKETVKGGKIRSEKSFLKQLFDNKKRHSAIDTSSVKLLPSISELDKQAAEIIENRRGKPSERNNNVKNVLLGRVDTQNLDQAGTWICVSCLRKYNSTVVSCRNCLPNVKTQPLDKMKDDINVTPKGSNSYTQTEKDFSNIPSSSNKCSAEEKQKLKKMLKEMKDSLPKKSKTDTNELKNIATSSKTTYTFTETPTLRVGSKVQQETKLQLVPQPTSSKITNNLASQPVVSTQKQCPFLTESALVTQQTAHNSNIKNVNSKTGNKNTFNKIISPVVSVDQTKHNKPEVLVKKDIKESLNTAERTALHTPLKISSLLNPVYVPKERVTHKRSPDIVEPTHNPIPNIIQPQPQTSKAEVLAPNDSNKLLHVSVPTTSNSTPSLSSQRSAAPIEISTKMDTKEIAFHKNNTPTTKLTVEVSKDVSPVPKPNENIKKSVCVTPSSNEDKVRSIETPNQHSKRRDLIQQLEQSIAQGDERAAADAAAKLAQLRLSCSVLSFSSHILSQASTSSSNANAEKSDIKLKTTPPKRNESNQTKNVLSQDAPIVLEKSAQSKQASGLKLDLRKDVAIPATPKTIIKPLHESDESGKEKAILHKASSSQLERNDNQNNMISIAVLVEDREATRGPVHLRITRQANMRDLRREAETSLGLATNLQRWIIGRTLCTEDNTPVAALAGADFSAPFYLCLVESDTKINTISRIQIMVATEVNAKHNDDKSSNVYTELVQLEQQSLVPNSEHFECGVCMEEYAPGSGVVLRECVHIFCKDCLCDVVRHCEEPNVPCPAMGCRGMLQEREIRAMVAPEDYERWLARGLAAAESGTRNAFHCRTTDCTGWALCEPGVQRFPCPVCKRINCVPCQAIHEGITCEQHRAKLKETANTSADINQTDEGTRTLLNSLISKGEALECPECKAIITKKWGCDWVKCSACKTEICWVTRGRRWGPAGRGDTSGGCRCGVDGKRCHPSCGYCH